MLVESTGVQPVNKNTVVKYKKENVRTFERQSVYAIGCLVEAVLLNKEGGETTKRYYGTVDINGNVIDSVTKEIGINLGEIGVYKIYFKGRGMNIIETFNQSSIEVPYSEIYEAQSVRGIVSSMLGEYRMVIDYETNQITFYHVENNVEKFILKIGVSVLSAFNGILLKNNSVINSEVGGIGDDLFVESTFNAFRSFIKSSFDGGGADINAYDSFMEGVAGIEDNLGSYKTSINKTGVGELAVGIFGSIKNGVASILRSITGTAEAYFLYNDCFLKSFHNGKLGIGVGKENPAQNLDVAENINADTGFIQGGLNVGITDNKRYRDVDGLTHNVVISGGIITEWTIS